METKAITVREDGEHPLQTAWTFWYDKKQPKKTNSSEFKDRLHKIGTFDTVESFWKLYLHLKRPSALETNMNIYLFRDLPNCLPMWEVRFICIITYYLFVLHPYLCFTSHRPFLVVDAGY